ncbi:MAG: orotidine-5'-phosphate decarboxylase [bacterium]|nr:orotidine-5'-phosphate decarboxylase [bacterium]
MSSYLQKLAAKAEVGKRLCVGVDPDTKKIPEGVSVGDFCLRIVRATVRHAAVFKVNVAFFEALGESGWPTLKSVIDEIHRLDSEMPIIGDAKRGDIGNTNRAYVEALFGQLGFDAVTLHNYLGWKGAGQVFTDCDDRGFYVLCRTTNPGAPEFQDLPCILTGDSLISGVEQKIPGQQIVPLYQVVAHKVATGWNGTGNCGLVVGATYPEELAQVRKIAPQLPFLIPGVGAQGGDLERAVEGAFSTDLPADFVVNVSSAVLYAYLSDQFKADPANFAEAAARAAEFYSSEIERIRSAHAALVSLGSST